MELPKRYESGEEEPKIQAFWKEERIFDQGGDPTFTIDTPPPTVSGRMHMGHAFSYAQGDFIARYRRMRGDIVFYPFGTDDNGLPTERLIEKQEGISAKRMERPEFRKRVLTAVKKQLPEFTGDWIRLGISADFEGAYSTIDDHCRKTSQKSFLDLHAKGQVYRKDTPVSWCVQCQTAIAQAEFENVEKESAMNTIAFAAADGSELLIMTTRPELIPACVALAAHPDDARYAKLKGTEAVVPISGHTVPFIYDEKADPEKGTGLMMVCTFGDKEDVEKWHTHKLDTRVIIAPHGKIAVGPHEGLGIKEARKQILSDLEGQGLLKKQERIDHAVNVHERCGTEIEFLPAVQWFVRVLEHKDRLLALGDEITWYPEFMKHRYTHWVQNLSWDWCISRQRPYGVPFPVWYHRETGETVVAEEDELPIDPTQSVPRAWKDRADELEPELDVMDTWATSSVTPQIALDWAENPEGFGKVFPMSLRLQAHDIIRTWAFYTIAKSMHHHATVPWNDIVISGHALDPKGKKMSKSKGNAVDPNEITARYGADALRFWAASTKLGEDLPYMEKDIVTGQKTVNKLWNASRFALMHLADYDGNVPEAELELIDAWLLTKFARIVEQATSAFDRYEYSRTKAEAENFFWNTFCDNYLELVKDRLYNEDRGEEAKRSAQFTLYTVLLGQLKLFAPIMPHVTEYIYRLHFAEREGHKSIHLSQWPAGLDRYVDAEAHQAGDILVDLLAEVRKAKSERQMSLREELPQATLVLPEHIRKRVELGLPDFQATARIADIEFADGEEPAVRFD